MKGYVSVVIPTKPYLKAWILNELGETPLMNYKHHIGSKLVDLLEYKRNWRPNEYAPHNYPAQLKVYISRFVFQNHGCHLNETNIIRFNSYLEEYFKSMVHWKLDVFVLLTENLDASMELLRDQLKLDEEVFPYELLKKDYYRYRKKNGQLFPKGGYKKRAQISINPII